MTKSYVRTIALQSLNKNINSSKIPFATLRFGIVEKPWLILSIFLLVTGISRGQGFSVYFDTDKSTLSDEARTSLDSLIETDHFKKQDSLFVACHCDSRADSAYNYALSIRRAKSVKRYIQKKGVDVPIRIYGYGEAKPDYPNSVDLRFKNRRCDLVLTIQRNESDISTIQINELDEGDLIRLDGLEFVGNQALPNYYSMPVLYQVLEVMLMYPDLKIDIHGHVCCGDDMGLSIARAKAVYDYLQQNGVDTSRISHRGFSNTKPLVREIDVQTQQRNRRVEIQILNAPETSTAGMPKSKFDFFVALREVPFKPRTHILTYTADYNFSLIASMIANSHEYGYVLHVYATDSGLQQRRMRGLQGFFKRKGVPAQKLKIIPGRDRTFRNQDILILEVNPLQ